MDDLARRARHSKISTALARLDDDSLRGLLDAESEARGWGYVQQIEIDGEPVFVKTIPLTDLEHDHPNSTRNHYRLPTYYQYGVGSAGFGAWRELATHAKTTTWVLDGVHGAFPPTYHVRIVPRAGLLAPPTSQSLDDYVRRWNSSQAVARYLTDRADGAYAALIFLEWLPTSIWDWLRAQPEDIERTVRDLCATVTFLREHGVVDFDAHFNNAMTDGERSYLLDFGLVLDSSFDLTLRERTFLERHRHYDYGGILFSIGSQLHSRYRSLAEADQTAVRARLGVADDPHSIRQGLVGGVERLGDLVHPALAEAVVRYREIIEFMDRFLSRLSANPRKDTRYDDDRLRRLLQAAGVIEGPL